MILGRWRSVSNRFLTIGLMTMRLLTCHTDKAVASTHCVRRLPTSQYSNLDFVLSMTTSEICGIRTHLFADLAPQQLVDPRTSCGL